MSKTVVILDMLKLEEIENKLNNIAMNTQLCDSSACSEMRTHNVFLIDAILLDAKVEVREIILEEGGEPR